MGKRGGFTSMSEQIIELVEFEPTYFEYTQLSYELGELMFKSFSNYINVDFPTPKTEGKWRITSLGWVGILRLNDELLLSLKPKINTCNVFTMWEYAYRLKSFKIVDGIVACNSIEAFYNQIASLLAKLIMTRYRKGLYKSYEDFSERLPYIAGHIDIIERLRNPFDIFTKCDYQENTTSNMENQILLWTLNVMLRGRELNQETKINVKKAYMSLQGTVELVPVEFSDCIGRNYNSLNSDYQLLHALCRFILEYTGPNSIVGKYAVMPFVVNMSRLYEMFIAEWLQFNLPEQFGLIAQEKITFGEDDKIKYNIDLVLYDKNSGSVICVIDTKYKKVDSIQNDDINQMLAYMEAKNCTIGILLYPIQISELRKYRINTKNIWQVGFDISGDIDESGINFVNNLSEIISPERYSS